MDAKAPLGIRASSAPGAVVLKGLSFCSSNSNNDNPEKSPAMPTLPNSESSRFASGAGVKEIARDVGINVKEEIVRRVLSAIVEAEFCRRATCRGEKEGNRMAREVTPNRPPGIGSSK